METVLLIEDNEDIADLSKHALQSQGYDAIVVRSRNAAVEFLRDDGIPAIIILDWHMPGMSIEKFILELTAMCKDHPLPRLILSTAGPDADKVAKSLSIPEVLRKPFDLTNPLKAVDGTAGVRG